MTDPAAEPERTTLVVVPVADPCERRGLPPRPVEVRLRAALKDLLRIYGLKCVVVRVPTAAELEAMGDWE